MQMIKLKSYPILNGIMAWWSSVEDAARYIVTLYINDASISEKVVERTEKYCAFTGLAAIDGQTRGAASSISLAIALAVSHAYGGGTGFHSGFDYYIKVQAENRNGEIIAESDKIKSTVREI